MISKLIQWSCVAVFALILAQFIQLAAASDTATDDTSASQAAAKKKILLIAGKPSHGYAQHEHNAGCLLLAKCLNESGLPIEAVVHQNGWPADAEKNLFDNVAAVIMYCDGGDKHMVNAHLEQLDQLAAKGVGIGAIHYGVEVPKQPSGSYFLNWIGGFFETDWSVNPTWVADFKQLPSHAVTRGVQPFSIKDEWYFHMRFPDGMDRVKPILTAIAPDSTMSRAEGPHEGNPTVRQEVAAGVPQHLCWIVERPDGGRGFGFTGGHYHWNWGNDQFRKLMLNMIVWIAKVDLPESGVPSKSLSVDDLMANQDKPVPKDFDKAKIESDLKEWNADKPGQQSNVQPAELRWICFGSQSR